jgi:hypothetical protein
LGKSVVSEAVRAATRELDLLPDDLYNKSKTFHIELDKINNQTKFSRRVEKKTNKKNYKIEMDCDNVYTYLEERYQETRSLLK